MSKELEALIRIEDLLDRLYETDVINDDHTHDTNIIGKALKRLEELEKAFKALSKEDEKTKKFLSLEIEKNRALEIIKNKKVNVRALLKSTYSFLDGLSIYNSQCYNRQEMESKELTQEEYELLKEVLEK